MAVGARDVLAERMTVGDFFSFTLYLGMLVGPVMQVVNIGSQITEAFAGLEASLDEAESALDWIGRINEVDDQEETRYMLLADYEPYIACQRRVGDTFRNPAEWTRMSILNVARMSWFSSDRTIRQYADEIWKASHWRTASAVHRCSTA
mgnify:CR=1 FL=1